MPPNSPIPYLQRVKSYYLALGYGAPYVWATFDEVPFQPLCKPLDQATIGIVTTANLYQPGKGNQGPGAAYNGQAKFYQVYTQSTSTTPTLGISHLAYDRTHSKADDQASYFPLTALRLLAESGLVAGIAPRFYGLPTNRSQKTTQEVDCPALLERCKEDRVDGVVLVANCPVCHQSVSLAARTLEANGIATVIMGCAKDIVEQVGVPRLLFSHFPLGNAAGLPHDPQSQLKTAQLALTLLVDASAPRTTLINPIPWPGPCGWEKDYCNAQLLSKEEIARRKAEFDRGKDEAKRLRDQMQTDDASP